MANFNEAYIKTLINEGGYSCNPYDRGGETYKGVSRHNFPNWQGWEIIDRLKANYPNIRDFIKHLEDDMQLQQLVKDFYKEKFWDAIRGDDIPNQEIADKVFDIGVNMGVRRSVKFLQESLNMLNRGQGDYQDIQVDGCLGPVTLGTIQAFLDIEKGKPGYLIDLLRCFQGMQYIDIMRCAAEQEIFARGWLNRLRK